MSGWIQATMQQSTIHCSMYFFSIAFEAMAMAGNDKLKADQKAVAVVVSLAVSQQEKADSRRLYLSAANSATITVGINPILSDPRGPRTSKVDWRQLKLNELQIHTNTQKGPGTKMAEKLNNFEKFKREKSNFRPVLNPERVEEF